MPLEIVACFYDTLTITLQFIMVLKLFERVISNDLVNISPFKYFYNYAFA